MYDFDLKLSWHWLLISFSAFSWVFDWRPWKISMFILYYIKFYLQIHVNFYVSLNIINHQHKELLSYCIFSTLYWSTLLFTEYPKSQYYHKIRERKGKTPKIEEITIGEAHANTQKLNRNISMVTAPLVAPVKNSSDAIFVVCLHTLILFWLRKTAVTVEIFRLSFHMFACAFPMVISSIFVKSFPFSFPLFCVIRTSVLSFRCGLSITSISKIRSHWWQKK